MNKSDEDRTGFSISQPHNTGIQNNMLSVEGQRAMMQVQGAIVAAKNFPRDEFNARKKILESCKRKKLAEDSQYSFPRGGAVIGGPSIRLAEVMANSWGNLDYGIRELSQSAGESLVESFCWDLESNVRALRTFTVKHEKKAYDSIKKLSDPRDIYEHTANQGARRLRACILEIIPCDIVDEAIEQCNETMAGGSNEPIADRAKKMLDIFEPFGITKELIEKRMGHNTSTISETELVAMRKIFLSIRDNMAKPEQYFDIPTPDSMRVDADNTEINCRKAQSEAKDPPANADSAIGEETKKTEKADLFEELIIDAQVADLKAATKEQGLKIGDVVQYLADKGIDSIAAIPKSQYSKIFDWVRSHAKKGS